MTTPIFKFENLFKEIKLNMIKDGDKYNPINDDFINKMTYIIESCVSIIDRLKSEVDYLQNLIEHNNSHNMDTTELMDLFMRGKEQIKKYDKIRCEATGFLTKTFRFQCY